jgi:hypothetical protein
MDRKGYLLGLSLHSRIEILSAPNLIEKGHRSSRKSNIG